MGTLHKFPTQAKPAPKKAPAKPTSDAGNGVNFTDAGVRAWLRNPPEGRPEFQDAADPKLRARVSKGRVAFSLYAWSPAEKKPKRWALGVVTSHTAPETTVEAVRKAAAILKGDIAKGAETATRKMEGTPAAQVAASAAVQTCADLLADYLVNKRRGGKPLRDTSRELYEDSMRTFLGRYYVKPIAELSPETVLSLYRARCERREAIDSRGKRYIAGNPVQALSALDALKAICRRHELPDVTELTRKRDEIIRAKGGRPNRITQATAPDLIAWAWRVAETDPHSYNGTGATMMLIGTLLGWRKWTVQQLQWGMFDFKRAVANLPGWIVKGDRDYCIPLPPRLCALLKARQVESASTLLFPQQADADKMAEPGSAFLATAPFKVSMHDGKKTLSMALAKAKAPQFAEKLLLMHSIKGNTTVEHYIATNDPDELVEELREYVVAVEDKLTAKVGHKPTLKAMDAAAYERDRAYRDRKAASAKKYRDRRNALRAAARAAKAAK